MGARSLPLPIANLSLSLPIGESLSPSSSAIESLSPELVTKRGEIFKRRYGDGGIFVGNLRKPIEEVIPKLEKKLSEAAGRDVVVWFMEEKTNDITKQMRRRN